MVHHLILFFFYPGPGAISVYIGRYADLSYSYLKKFGRKTIIFRSFEIYYNTNSHGCQLTCTIPGNFHFTTKYTKGTKERKKNVTGQAPPPTLLSAFQGG